uniref:Uncharacterized protein n=1 Tax=Sphaerodactylus townsendi TaxID=933632 RepID=A0ACB8FTR6_9SAUR
MSSSNDIAEVMEKGLGLFNVAMTSTANVLVVHGNTETIMILRMMLYGSIFENRPVEKKIWLMTAQMEFTSLSFQRDWDLDFIHGAISFAIHSVEVPGFQEFLRRRNPRVEEEDGFLKDFWKDTFKCWFHDSVSHKKAMNICTGEENLETLPGSVFEMSMNGHSYSVYNAVYAVAHAAHAMRLSTFRQRNPMNGETWKLNQPPWQLHHFLRNSSFNNTAGEEVSFDQNGELIAGFDIINWVTFPNQSFLRVRVGRIDPKAPPNNIFTIHEDAIVWPSGFDQTHTREALPTAGLQLKLSPVRGSDTHAGPLEAPPGSSNVGLTPPANLFRCTVTPSPSCRGAESNLLNPPAASSSATRVDVTIPPAAPELR